MTWFQTIQTTTQWVWPHPTDFPSSRWPRRNQSPRLVNLPGMLKDSVKKNRDKMHPAGKLLRCQVGHFWGDVWGITDALLNSLVQGFNYEHFATEDEWSWKAGNSEAKSNLENVALWGSRVKEEVFCNMNSLKIEERMCFLVDFLVGHVFSDYRNGLVRFFWCEKL